MISFRSNLSWMSYWSRYVSHFFTAVAKKWQLMSNLILHTCWEYTQCLLGFHHPSEVYFSLVLWSLYASQIKKVTCSLIKEEKIESFLIEHGSFCGIWYNITLIFSSILYFWIVAFVFLCPIIFLWLSTNDFGIG